MDLNMIFFILKPQWKSESFRLYLAPVLKEVILLASAWSKNILNLMILYCFKWPKFLLAQRCSVTKLEAAGLKTENKLLNVILFSF